MTLEGVDRVSAAAAPMSHTVSHATWATVKTAGLRVVYQSAFLPST